MQNYSYNLCGLVRHQGLPFAQVKVRVHDLFEDTVDDTAGEVLEACTGARGEFAFSLKLGTYRVEVIPPETTRFLKQVVEDVRVAGNTTLNLNLQTGNILSGLVRYFDKRTVDGVRENIFVIASSLTAGSYSSRCQVGRDGRYSLVLPKGQFQIVVCQKTGDVAGNITGEALARGVLASPVELLDIEADMELHLSLPPLITLTGSVVDQSGAPVKAALVKLTIGDTREQSPEVDLNCSCQTDEAGYFELALGAGTYKMDVIPPEGSILFPYGEQDLEILENTVRKITLTEGFRLRGQVAYQERFLSNCLVRVENAEKSLVYMAKTQDDGQFSLTVSAGTYMLTVSAHPRDTESVVIDGEEHSSLAPWTRSVVVGGDTHVAVKLGEGTALRGYVLDEEGLVKPSVRVAVYLNSGKKPDEFTRPLAIGLTNGDGKYSFFLSPGSYFLVVHRDYANTHEVKVEGEPVSHDIVWKGWLQVVFELLSGDGKALSHCKVFYSAYGQDNLQDKALVNGSLPRGSGVTGDDGCCRLALPAGIYTFRFSPPESSAYEGKVIRQLSISSDIHRKLLLERKAT
jgi:hypothetical protein